MTIRKLAPMENQTYTELEELAHGVPAMNELTRLYQTWEGGNIDALAAYIAFDRIAKAAEDFKNLLKDNALAEADKWGEKTFKYMGVEVQKKAAAGRWDYKGVKQWAEAKANLSAIEERAKAAAEMYLKFGTQAVSEDGELIEGARYTAGKDTLAIKA
jgi:hypothetical protein